MQPNTAERLLRATGASSLFVDDVLGDLEELRAQRQRAGVSCGRWWYMAEVVRALPHAQRTSLQGVGVSQLVDWGQKALAAWVLLGVASVIGGGMTYGVWASLNPSAERAAIWMPSDLFVVALLTGAAAHYVVLGYVAAWMERDRPLMVTLTAALLGVGLHTAMVREGLTEVGAGVLVLPVMVGLLISAGGVWRVMRAEHNTARIV